MSKGLSVHSEIGTLRKVMLHRPGEELLNLVPDELPHFLFDDIPYLEVAQQEHDTFAQVLRNQGVEVVYLEHLVAQALDAAGSRDEFCTRWLEESGLRGKRTRAAVREFMDSIEDTEAFVCKCIAGVRANEVDLPIEAGSRLADHIRPGQGGEVSLLVDPMPNTYFTRDPFAVVGHGVCLNHMYSNVRNRETLLGWFLFRDHPDFKDTPLWYHRDSAFHMEGGDILNLSAKRLAIGISQRTQASAIDTLAQHLLWERQDLSEVESILAFNIPVSRAFMHLDTVFTQIDVDKFTIHPGIMGTLQVFELSRGSHPGSVRIVERNDTLEHILADALGLDSVLLVECGAGDPVAAAREQWNDGSNTLAVAPGRICVYQRNNVTNEALYKAGLDLLVVPSAELSRGRGGPRCMSMPFERDEVFR